MFIIIFIKQKTHYMYLINISLLFDFIKKCIFGQLFDDLSSLWEVCRPMDAG